MTKNNSRPDHGPLIGGMVLILVGTFLLIAKMGYLPYGLIFHFWPMIFIMIGVVKLAYGSDRVVGTILIGVGLLLQLSEIGVLHVHFWDLWPLVVIAAGGVMLWQALGGRELLPGTSNPQFDSVYIFGGTERKVNTKNFKGGRLLAVFGGYKLDFERAEMEGNEVVLEASAICGGGEIIVPQHWLVSIQGTAMFGGYEDKARHVQTDPSQPTKTLILKGFVMFGGISIKN
jgi:predicted membrane protein